MTDFFDGVTFAKRKDLVLRSLPPIPDTGWRRPTTFPDLTDAAVIGVDVETKETDFKHGPGWARGKGHIVGISLAAISRSGQRGKWYFPVRHEVDAHDNLDPAATFKWLRQQLHTPRIPKVFANALYDIGWLTTEGIFVEGELHDVQFAEALLDDQAFVALEYLGEKYLKRGKSSDTLFQWLRDAYGVKKDDQRENIYRSPPRLAGPYAEDDADMPLDIALMQFEDMGRQNLLPVYRMECDLIPLLVSMRLKGVQIDINYAEQLYHELGPATNALYAKLSHTYGVKIDSVNSGTQLSKLFDTVGLKYPLTSDGNPSFRKEFLKGLNHPLADSVNEIREHIKIRNTFIHNYLIESHVDEKIYCQFHPLRSDEGGTITGRFSSSDPNLQNIPVKTELGKKVRACFVKDKGHFNWRKIDYSQIEYRMLAHYAVDLGDGSADRLRQTYIDDPTTDYHNVVMVKAAPLLGKDLSKMSKSEIATFRKPIKNVNFGLLYGQGAASLAYKAGMNPKQAKEFFVGYHKAAPYVEPTMDAIMKQTNKDGFVTTLLGRRTRFNLWEPDDYSKQKPLPVDQAIRYYGSNIKRAGLYKAINYCFQGSGTGDVIKAAMLNAWKSGVYNEIGVPRLQVHDELAHSLIDDPDAHREAWKFYIHTLETSIPFLKVPVIADVKDGPNWGAID